MKKIIFLMFILSAFFVAVSLPSSANALIVGYACFHNDKDCDGVENETDNCIDVKNTDQADSDDDGVGDACETGDVDNDTDNDGVVNEDDNCPDVSNYDQEDVDENGVGDACDDVEIDSDRDGVYDSEDNCPSNSNSRQADSDADGIGDRCDNCISVPNPDQANTNGDFIGDACESDWDKDGVGDSLDNCKFKSNPDQADADKDGRGDVCDVVCVGTNCSASAQTGAGWVPPLSRNNESSCSLVAVANMNGSGVMFLIFSVITGGFIAYIRGRFSSSICGKKW